MHSSSLEHTWIQEVFYKIRAHPLGQLYSNWDEDQYGSIVDQVLFLNFYSSVPSFNHKGMCFLIEIFRIKIKWVYAKYEIDHNFIPLSTTYTMMYVVF